MTTPWQTIFRRWYVMLAMSFLASIWAIGAFGREIELAQEDGVETAELELADDEQADPLPRPQRRDAEVEQVLEQVSLQFLAAADEEPETADSNSMPADVDVPQLDNEDSTPSGEQPSGKAINLDGKKLLSPSQVQHRWEEGTFDWVFRNGDNGLGMFSLQSTSSRELSFDDPSKFDINFEYSIHFLSGPLKSDLPPRLFDLYFNVHWLQQLGDGIGFDANFDLGLYTDFEDSVRKGWRYPGRALAFWNLDGQEGTNESSELTLLGGIEFFDTARLRAIPAAGLIWQPDENLRYELYFPRPQIKWRLSHDDESDQWLYLRGELVASAWAIERSNGDGDVVSLIEKRIAVGVETRSWESDGETSFMEIGYVFDRHLEYGSRRGNSDPSNGIMFRLGGRY